MLPETYSGAGMKSYLFGLRSAGQVVLALLLAAPASAQVINYQRLVASVSDARTIASNGGGTPASLTLTPTATYVPLTCNDTDGCTITMGETGIPNGMSVLIVNVSANACTFSDTSGVSELTGSISLSQWQTLALEYVTDRWVQSGTGGGAGTVTTTGSPASGNLAKFSGAASLTNADLTGAVTTSGTLATTLANDIVANANLRNSGALSVIGRSANSSGDPADISASAASDAVLRESGSTVGFGTIATAGIANDAVTFAKIQNSSTTSVLVGRGGAAGTGDYQEIALGAGLSLAGTTISATVVGTGGGDVVGPASATNNGFTVYDGTTGKLVKDHAATIALGSEVSGDLPFANLTQGSALSVLGVTGNATADNASIAAGSDHQVLRRSGTAVAFGAVNLAQSAAVTGILPIANIATGTPDGTKFVRDDGTLAVPAGTGMVRLSQVVTSGSQATVDFTSISGSYTTLKVLIYAQDTAAGTSDSAIYLKVNNDGTSGNYTATQRSGAVNGGATVTTLAATANGSQAGLAPNSGTTGSVGTNEVTIVGYASTTFNKNAMYCGHDFTTTANGSMQCGGFQWKSTAAITRLTFTAGGTAFTNGSIFTLYGIP
jgi:hypothetical protein